MSIRHTQSLRKFVKKSAQKKICKERGHHITERIAGKDDFIEKAYGEWRKGKTCVLLIPAATGTKQFHDLIYPHAEIRFIRGRVAFEGYNTKGEFVTTKKGKHDSMIVIFKHEECKACDGVGWYSDTDRNGDQIQVQCEECMGTGKV